MRVSFKIQIQFHAKVAKFFRREHKVKYKNMFIVTTDYMINTKRFSLYLICESVARYFFFCINCLQEKRILRLKQALYC